MNLKALRRGVSTLLLAAAGAVSVATPASAGHDGSCRIDYEDGDICLYEHIQYGGGMLDFTRTDRNYTSAADVFYDMKLPTFDNVNDQVSSIKNRELTCEWWIYPDAEFGGAGFIYRYGQDLAYLYENNDVISSHYKWTGSQECTNGSTGL